MIEPRSFLPADLVQLAYGLRSAGGRGPGVSVFEKMYECLTWGMRETVPSILTL
jgi:hypothetical protein